MAPSGTTVHAAAVLVGARAVLIRGPSGVGKSRLALQLIQAADAGTLRFTRLVGDDRVHLSAAIHRNRRVKLTATCRRGGVRDLAGGACSPHFRAGCGGRFGAFGYVLGI